MTFDSVNAEWCLLGVLSGYTLGSRSPRAEGRWKNVLYISRPYTGGSGLDSSSGAGLGTGEQADGSQPFSTLKTWLSRL